METDSTPLHDPKFVLGVDLDGVCADFSSGLRPIAAEWLGVAEGTLPEDVSYGFKEWNLDVSGGYERLHRYAVTQRELFSKLQPIKGAPQVLRNLAYVHDVRVRIITHRLFIKYFHEIAVMQTVQWLDRHGIPYYDLCFMETKAAVGADLYIEDTPKNIEALRADDHEVIVFTNSTNKSVGPPRADGWGDVQRLVLEALQRWRAAGKDKRKSAGL